MQSYEEDVQLHEELAYDLQLQGNDTKDLLDERWAFSAILIQLCQNGPIMKGLQRVSDMP